MNITLDLDLLKSVGLTQEDISVWENSKPRFVNDFGEDSFKSSRYFEITKRLLAKFPLKPQRNEMEAQAVKLLSSTARDVREKFLSIHVVDLYTKITHDFSRFVRVEDLSYEAARLVPGLTPSREEVHAEVGKMLKDKEDIEIDQGIFFAHVFSHEKTGLHLCHAMLLPREESLEKLEYLKNSGSIDLEMASVETIDGISWVTIKNPAYLNAEDDVVIGPLEEAVDLAILDDRSNVAVLRGDVSQHPKYMDRRVMTAGLNINHLYHGKIPYLWYLKRDLGYIHKIYRGLAYPDRPADDVFGSTKEKPWICQVDTFAIGSGCQFLIASDYAVAADDAYLTLPASKEGVVPGVANLRLSRFVGERMAHQLIMMGRRINCSSLEALLICDEVVPAELVEFHVKEAARNLVDSGINCVVANRRAFRVSHEPLNLFREYMAVYARDEAYLHFSDALIRNLEKISVTKKA